MSKLRRELARGITRGDLVAAERCLRKGADPNAADEHGIPHLHEAAWRGHAELVSLLIRYGANAHAVEPRIGRNALDYLLLRARMGRSADELVPALKVLMAAGLNPETGPPGYFSPWRVALDNSTFAPFVKAMLDAGVDPNKPFDHPARITPLMAAALGRAEESVMLLLQAGANPNARSTSGHTAAEWVELPEDHDEGWAPDITAAVLRLLRGGEQQSC
jgi:ankyrin repeat protein